MEKEIIVDAEMLSQAYMPEKLLHRDKERSHLLSNLKSFVNTFVCGSCGSGKTALAKHAIAEFNTSKKGYAVYTDCAIYQTTYSVLKEILPRSELIFYRSNYELIKELGKYAKNNKFALILDNFEQLKEKDLIARFMSLGLCLVLISESEESFAELDTRIRSNVPSIIRLQDYTTEQSFDIIKARAEKALAKWTYTDAVLKKIAEKIKGNITLGINALKAAALKAEGDGKRAIDESDVQIEDDCPNPRLGSDEKIILRILQEWKSLPSSRLYTFYVQNSRHPKGERSFRNYMESLCQKGLARAVGEKRGRVYEFEGGEDVQGHD